MWLFSHISSLASQAGTLNDQQKIQLKYAKYRLDIILGTDVYPVIEISSDPPDNEQLFVQELEFAKERIGSWSWSKKIVISLPARLSDEGLSSLVGFRKLLPSDVDLTFRNLIPNDYGAWLKRSNHVKLEITEPKYAIVHLSDWTQTGIPYERPAKIVFDFALSSEPLSRVVSSFAAEFSKKLCASVLSPNLFLTVDD